MTLNFPNAPSLHQIYISSPQEWIFDGEKWGALNSQGSLSLYLPLTGGELASPGNLQIDGTLQVVGATTLHAASATTLNVTGATTLGAATGVTMATADSSLNLATTAYVKNQGYATTAQLGGYLPLSGGTLSGQLNGTGATFSGNVIGNNSVQSNGVYFQNVSGCFYSPYSFYTGNVVYVGNTSIYWQNQSNWMYTNANLYAGGVVGVSGSTSIYWQNNGGWMYCPVGVWCHNINTNDIQCNGANINGVNILNFSQGAIGGYGSINFAWANGNWWGAQNSDALYAYTNQGLAGGCYWSFCDERMKWNFSSVERDCLAAINAIELRKFDFSEGPPPQRRVNPEETRPEFFRWEDLPRKVKHFEAGFIAQQLRELIPEAVPDPPEEGFFLSVDMRPLVATLIGAVQQLTERLSALEAA